MTIKYFIFLTNYLFPQIDLNTYFDLKLKILSLLIIMIFLLINKTKRIIKKAFLLNFFVIFFVSWNIYFLNLIGIEIFINKYISDSNLYEFKNINILNILYLFIFEIFYNIWSFMTYQNNLSDWSIPYPDKEDLISIYNIIIFYIGVIIYYYIFNSIN